MTDCTLFLVAALKLNCEEESVLEIVFGQTLRERWDSSMDGIQKTRGKKKRRSLTQRQKTGHRCRRWGTGSNRRRPSDGPSSPGHHSRMCSFQGASPIYELYEWSSLQTWWPEFFFPSSRPEYSLIRTATSPLSGAVPGCLYDQSFVQTRLDWTGPLLKPVQSSVLSPVSTIDHFTVLVPLPVLYPDQLVFLGQFSHLYSVLFSEGCCCQTISGSRSVLEKKKKKVVDQSCFWTLL